MRKAIAQFALVLGLVTIVAAQFTTVTGTVTDPNGLPYAGGTISALLVTSASPTLTGQPYTPPTQPSGLDKNGKFTIRLGDNSILLPAATKWNFTVCSAGGTIQPASGKGPVCFTLLAPITISGASQDISANLNAIAPALSLLTGTFTGGAVSSQITEITGCATPGYGFTAAATSGLCLSGTSVGIATGGVAAFTVDTSQNINLNNAVNVHLNNGFTVGDLAGKQTCSGTSRAINFGTAYTATPAIVATGTNGTVTISASSNTGFTVTCSSNNDPFSYIVIGAPN